MLRHSDPDTRRQAHRADQRRRPLTVRSHRRRIRPTSEKRVHTAGPRGRTGAVQGRPTARVRRLQVTSHVHQDRQHLTARTPQRRHQPIQFTKQGRTTDRCMLFATSIQRPSTPVADPLRESSSNGIQYDYTFNLQTVRRSWLHVAFA